MKNKKRKPRRGGTRTNEKGVDKQKLSKGGWGLGKTTSFTKKGEILK